jgi:hypothetical protein
LCQLQVINGVIANGGLWKFCTGRIKMV